MRHAACSSFRLLREAVTSLQTPQTRRSCPLREKGEGGAPEWMGVQKQQLQFVRPSAPNGLALVAGMVPLAERSNIVEGVTV